MAKMSEKTVTVLKFLQENQGENLVAQDIADATGLPKKSVEGIITAGLQRKDLAYREPKKVKTTAEDGSEKIVEVKFIRLTDAGKAFVPGVTDAEPADAE